MSLLANVSQGRLQKPMIHTAYGIPGAGKTTWASQFPKPLIIDLENGSGHLDVARLEGVDSFEKFKDILRELLTTQHGFETIVIDSLESLEHLMCDWICLEGGVKSIEAYSGGFGKGFQRLREIGREVMILERQLCDKKGVTVINIGHSLVKSHTDPADNTTFDRYTMRVNDKLGAVIRDLSDNVFFIAHKIYTTKEQGKTKAFSDGQRVMYTSWRAAYDAKSRLNIPHELPLSYQAFKAAIESSNPKTLEDAKVDLIEMTKGLDQETKTKAQEAIKNAQSLDQLNVIKTRIQTLIG